jgi:hypothetical protein
MMAVLEMRGDSSELGMCVEDGYEVRKVRDKRRLVWCCMSLCWWAALCAFRLSVRLGPGVVVYDEMSWLGVP